jgi:hypothetical protein
MVDGQMRMSGVDGDRHEHQAPVMSRLMLPAVCNSNDAGRDNCNGWLNQEFDEPALPVLEAAIAHLRPLDAADTLIFARWWTKRMLLSKHPAVREQHWKTDQRPWTLWQPDWLPDLRATGEFPMDLTLWMWIDDIEGAGKSLPSHTSTCLARSSTTGQLAAARASRPRTHSYSPTRRRSGSTSSATPWLTSVTRSRTPDS